MLAYYDEYVKSWNLILLCYCSSQTEITIIAQSRKNKLNQSHAFRLRYWIRKYNSQCKNQEIIFCFLVLTVFSNFQINTLENLRTKMNFTLYDHTIKIQKFAPKICHMGTTVNNKPLKMWQSMTNTNHLLEALSHQHYLLGNISF